MTKYRGHRSVHRGLHALHRFGLRPARRRGRVSGLDLIVLDVTIAGLFWAWGADEDVLAHLIKKTLYVGFFAFLIGNSNLLASGCSHGMLEPAARAGAVATKRPATATTATILVRSRAVPGIMSSLPRICA